MGPEGATATPATSATPATPATPAIRAEKLTKNYGKSRGIVALDLEVQAGEVFGFLGPNGAGKTTTIRVLLDLIRPTTGRVLVLGRDSHRDTLAIQARSGYLPGELSLYPTLTGSETLRYLANLRGGVEWEHVRALSERLDCDLTKKVSDLSSGNKRKLGLISAFMARPELLILDEPTSGLDPLVQHEFYALIDEVRDAGQTVFLSSHVLPEVQRVCDRVAFIREGRLIALEDVSSLTGRAVREIVIDSAADVPWEKCARRAVSFVSEDLIELSKEGGRTSLIRAQNVAAQCRVEELAEYVDPAAVLSTLKLDPRPVDEDDWLEALRRAVRGRSREQVAKAIDQALPR